MITLPEPLLSILDTAALALIVGSILITYIFNRDRSRLLYAAIEITASTLGWCLFALTSAAQDHNVFAYLALTLALFLNLPLASSYQRNKERARDAKAKAFAQEAAAKNQEAG